MRKLLAQTKAQDFSELVTRALTGSAAAQQALVTATLPLVYGLLYRLVGQRGELDDLSQNVYLRCFRSLGSFRREASFTTWLGSICVNVARDHFAKAASDRRLASETALHVLSASGSNTESEAIARERLQAIAKALAELSPTLRVPFVLHVLEELDIHTVAAMTASSVEATYKNVARAREKIDRLSRKDAAVGALFADDGRKS